MRDAGIGRILVASLHQSITDLMPSRVEFYENWLSPIGLRDGTIGLAPLAAVLSFLRREDGMYGPVTERAGEYAGEWTVLGLGALRRASLRIMPRAWRARAALGVARDLVRTSYTGSRARVRIRRQQAQVDVRSSIFCGVREPVADPLCGFYAAAFRRVLQLLEVPAVVEVVQCRGVGDAGCVLSVALAPQHTASPAGAALHASE